MNTSWYFKDAFFWHLVHNLWQKILQGLIEHTYDKIISILLTHSSLSISCLTLELFSSALIVELIQQVFGVCSFFFERDLMFKFFKLAKYLWDFGNLLWLAFACTKNSRSLHYFKNQQAVQSIQLVFLF